MEYIRAILGYLSWPAMILVSYLFVRWALRLYDRRFASEQEREE